MLRVEALTRLQLGPFDFIVADGACLAITGPSGAGKSVLLRAIADLDPNDGHVATARMARHLVSGPTWRGGVVLLPAESGWWGDTVAQHFRAVDTMGPLLDQVGLSAAALSWDVARLSTGERHRLALLRALELCPEVLLLDEPTTMLDKTTTILVETLLKQRMVAGLSIVLVTHDTDQPGRIADSVMQLKAGQLQNLPVQG